uniref:LisH domain-containing protein n=1 Tax=Anopheles minimus TaxID=112268 RepID=A0A182W4P9_9DIPT
MEEETENILSVLVYHYLMEQCLGDVAEMYAAKSPYLKPVDHSPGHCMLTKTPLQSLHGIVMEHVSLLRNMKGLVQKYYTKAPVPYGKNTFDKIKFLLDYFYDQAARNFANENGTADGSENDSLSKQTPVVADTIQYSNEQPPLLLMNVEESSNVPCNSPSTNNSAAEGFKDCSFTENLTDQPQPPLEQEPEREGTIHDTTNIESNSFVSMSEQPNECSEMPGNVTKVTVSYKIRRTEILTMRSHCAERVIPMEEVAEQYAGNMQPAKLMIEPAPTDPTPVIPPVAAECTELSSEAVPATGLKRKSYLPFSQCIEEESTPDVVIDLTETPSTTSLNANSPKSTVRRTPVDPDALAEWKRIRSINSSNFDDYIRQRNSEAELKRMQERKRIGTNQPKTRSPTTFQIRSRKITYTKPSTLKKKDEKKPAVRQPVIGTATGKRFAATEANKRLRVNDSDSTDFASSADEDDDVREMRRRSKEYRLRQKNNEAKEKSLEDSPASAIVSHGPPCGTSLGRSRRIAPTAKRSSTLKRGLHNRTPSTSPVGPPSKLSTPATEYDSRAVMFKNPARQLVNAAESELAASMSKRRQPVRTVNRKTKVASVASDEFTEWDTLLNTPKPATVTTDPLLSSAQQQPPPFESNPVAVDAGEAAIDAILAQLHGDN